MHVQYICLRQRQAQENYTERQKKKVRSQNAQHRHADVNLLCTCRRSPIRHKIVVSTAMAVSVKDYNAVMILALGSVQALFASAKLHLFTAAQTLCALKGCVRRLCVIHTFITSY